ncbi:MAG: YggS family pyridoxal phosphate-dependent enzyme [Clostridia bacterium]|nr:YggS family pyridoxal phosphate-dependent enzyme [Clostridia bacterium]
MEYIRENLDAITSRIRDAEDRAGRRAGSVKMVAAVKYAEDEEIRELCRLGVRTLGENRVQQLLSHYEALGEEREGVEFHFIGSLQTNKVKYIIDKVTLIHSLDSLRLADEIEKQAAKRGIVMDVLVEVNSGEEESKGGILPSELEAFCASLSDYRHLRLCGCMTMAPKCDKKEEYLKYFQQTYKQVLDIWTKKLHNINRTEIPLLSMGMSESFEEAIASGSDLVRIGRSLFYGREEVKK